MSVGERLVVGLVRGVHGLRGTVRVETLSDRAPARFAAGRRLFAEGSESPLTIDESQPDAVGWRIRFAEVRDRTAAEALVNVYLEAIVEPGEELPRGEYYWHEVIGAHVVDTAGRALGDVVDIYRAGGAEVLLVRGPAGEIDVPMVRAVVRIFAPRRGEIVVDADALGLDGEPEDDALEAPEPEASEAEASGPPEAPQTRPGGGDPVEASDPADVDGSDAGG